MVLLTFLFAAMGWCGTPYPGWWWHRPHPDPGPDPFKSRILPGIVAALGGVAAGLAAYYSLAAEATTTSALAAFAGGRILSSFAIGITAQAK